VSLLRRGAISRRIGLTLLLLLKRDPALVSCLGFEEGSGDITRDAYTWAMYDPTKISWVTGKVGKALEFQGVAGSYIRTPYSPFALQIFSISVWIKASTSTGQGAYGTIFDTEGYILPNFYGFSLSMNHDNGKLMFWCYKGDGTGFQINGTTDLRDDTWHHIVAICKGSGSTMELYVDTNLEASGNLTFNIAYGGTTYAGIGACGRWGGYRFKGIIDEFYFFSKVLSASERNVLYNV